MPDRCHRRSIRLRGYDYTRSGAYYVTVCTHDRLPLFGDVLDRAMVPNSMGDVVQRCWDVIPTHMPMVELDEFIVMPNHVHGIIVITDGALADRVGPGNFPPPRTMDGPPPDPGGNMPTMQRGSLGHIIQTFKAAVSRQVVKEGLVERGTPIWQRGYYERIIRDAAEHDRIAQYITENPANWPTDRLFG